LENELLLPKNVVCGYFDCSEFANLTLSPRRQRTRFEIEFYLCDGKGLYSNENVWSIRKNHILIGKPGDVCNHDLPFRTKFLKFEADGALADRLMEATPYFCPSHPFETEELLDALIAMHSSPELDMYAFYGKLLSLLALVLQDSKASSNAQTPYDEVILRAKGYMEQNLSKQIRLSDIASSASLSPSYFHSMFTAACGITPHDYLLECRIRAAKHLLAVTSLSIGEIAEQCGFGTQQYMNYIFREKVGESPGRCRRAFRQDYLK